jgi:poly-gamma-glutamate capsule biosynthesis protein CapA/YwtB (metallophosphatase superfamily)
MAASIAVCLCIATIQPAVFPQAAAASPRPTRTTAAPAAPTAAPSDEDTPPAPAADATVTLLAVGDLMCHSQQYNAARTRSGYDFRPEFKAVKSDIASADIAAGNLETTLRSVGPFSGYPTFRSPRAYADALKYAGFDVLTTANNHALDGGAKGLRYTDAYLDKLGLAHTGTDKDGPAIVEHDGLKVAFLAYTYGTNGIHSPFAGAVNRIGLARMRVAITAAHKKADFVVVVPHWGNEYTAVPESATRKLGHALINAGADLILGSHPHVVRPVERYKGRYIVYSMGNLLTGSSHPRTDLGIMVKATIIRRGGVVKISAIKVIPTYRDHTRGAGTSSYRVVRISREIASPDARISATDLKRMRTYRTYCRKMFGKLL